MRDRKLLKDSCTPKAHSSMGDCSQNLETWHPLHSLQTMQQVGECPFHQNSLQMVWPQGLLYSLACLRGNLSSLHYLLRGISDLVNLANFRKLLKLFWVVYPLVCWGFFCQMECSNLEETCMQHYLMLTCDTQQSTDSHLVAATWS